MAAGAAGISAGVITALVGRTGTTGLTAAGAMAVGATAAGTTEVGTTTGITGRPPILMKPSPGTPIIGIVVLQPTPFCNINCSYCYLPQRNDKTVMTDATLRAVFERIFASGWASADLSLIWHAG